MVGSIVTTSVCIFPSFPAFSCCFFVAKQSRSFKKYNKSNKVYSKCKRYDRNSRNTLSNSVSLLICANHVYLTAVDEIGANIYWCSHRCIYVIFTSCHKTDISVKDWFIFKDSYESFQHLFCEWWHLTILLLQVLCIIFSYRFHLCAQP